MNGLLSRVAWIVFGATAALTAGCGWLGRNTCDPEYAAVVNGTQQAWCDPNPAAMAVDPVVAQLAGPQGVDAYVRYALSHNPEIQAARKRVEALANRVPQAASLPDPMFDTVTFLEPVQTAAGEQEVLLGVKQKIPWFGKLGTKADIAEWDTEAARAQLAAAELAVIERVRRAYYELYFIQQAIRITEADRELLLDLTKIAESKYRTNQVTQQDVLRAELEVSNLDSELIQLNQQLQSARAQLAQQLHISPETQLQAADNLPPEQIPSELDRLYEQAILARPELHAQLATIQRDRRAVDLAQLDYCPDVTLGFSWIGTSASGLSAAANGRDPLLLGIGVNVPIYRKRLDAHVRETEAQAVSSARQYDALRDQTLQEVKDLFARAISQRDLLRLFREDIIPKAEQTLNVSSRAYQTGDVDFLQLVDNWRLLLRYELTYQRLEAQLRQTLASLERALGGSLAAGFPPEGS